MLFSNDYRVSTSSKENETHHSSPYDGLPRIRYDIRLKNWKTGPSSAMKASLMALNGDDHFMSIDSPSTKTRFESSEEVLFGNTKP